MNDEKTPSKSINISVKTESKEKTQIPAGASFAKFKIMVMSGKGGVGKSTVASNLAYSFSLLNYKTGILDIDLTGPSIPKMLGIEEKIPEVEENSKKLIPIWVKENLVAMSLQYFVPNDKALVWRGSMRYKAIKNFLVGVNWGNLDILIIDMPPGTGDEPINIVQQIPDANGSVIVSTPQKVATQDVKKSILFSKRVNLPVLGVIENMSGMNCPHCHKMVHVFGESGAKELAEDMNVDFLGFIPLDPQIVIDGDYGQSSVLHDNLRPVFTSISQKIIEKLKK